MKTLCCLVLAALLCVPWQSARAGFDDIGFSCVAKKIDEDVTSSGKESRKDSKGVEMGVAAKTEHWGYTISLENKTFQPMTDLEVKYIVFYKQEQLGTKGPPREQRLSGSSTIKAIASHGKLAFDTDPVELNKAHLMGASGSYTYFLNGANPKAEDSLAGIWVRIYQNGKIVGEFTKPSNLASKEKWDE